MPRQLPKIPDGWRLLRDDEKISKGDRWFNLGPNAHALDWSKNDDFCAGNKSTKFNRYNNEFKWITPAPEEKVWLNPWD